VTHSIHDTKTLQQQLVGFIAPDILGAAEFAFRCMEIAEEEIAFARARYPLFEKGINSAFRVLCPPDSLRSVSSEVYRHHCCELLERVTRNADMHLGTDAECLCALSEASIAALPNRRASLLYWRLFNRVLPLDAERIRMESGSPAFDLSDEHAVNELEASLRVELSRDRGVL
jgi:hypothetical protein